MNNTDSPAISRRQRVEDSKYSISAINVLPVLSSPICQERSSVRKDPPPSNYKINPTLVEKFEILISSRWQKFRSQFPKLKKVQELVLRVPPRVRCVLIFFWFAWKIVLLLAFLVILAKKRQNTTPSSSSSSAIAQVSNVSGRSHIDDAFHTNADATKVLYIVTSPSEYNDGSRDTVEGQDRFLDQLLPVMIDSVESMVGNPTSNLEVDVFLVCEYILKPEREEMIRNRLPFGVGFQFWDDATPLAYAGKNTSGSIIKDKRALARQHRFVVRDKLEFYDMFIAFDDDMLVRGQHVKHYLQLSAEIERLLTLAPNDLQEKENHIHDYNRTSFFGDMTKQQLERLVPGFIRVEATVNEKVRGAQSGALPIPIHREVNVDPTICCQLNEGSSDKVPETPALDDLIAWETNIKSFSLRQFPPESNLLDWVALMLGPGNDLRQDQKIGGFWSGRKGVFKGDNRPFGGKEISNRSIGVK
jgi:hypothetical protein